MNKSIKNIIVLTSFFFVFLIPLFFDNRLINFNIIHRFIFSIIAFIIFIFLCNYRFKYSASPQVKLVFISILLFLFFVLISSEVNDRLVLAFEDFALYLSIIIFAYLVFLIFQKYEFDDLITYISFTITLACLIISILGIFEFFDINLLKFRFNSRPGSTLGIRNFASEYSVLALPFLLIIYYKSRNVFYKIFALFSLLVILVFIFYCRTRTSLVVILAYLILITAFYIKARFFYEKKLTKSYILILLVLVISYIIGMYTAPNLDKERPDLNNTVSSIIDEKYPENVARINYWKTSLKIFRKDPVTGIGSGSWFGIYPGYNGNRYTDKNILVTSEINPHNEYFEVLSENGILGFIFYMLLLFLIFKNLLTESLNNLLILPLFLSFVGFMIISFFSFPKDNVAIVILLSTLIGISLSLMNRNEEIEDKKIFKKYLRYSSLVALPLILISLIVFNYIRYTSEITYFKAMEDKAVNNYSSMLEKFRDINTLFYPLDANRIPVEFYKGVGEFETKNYNEALNSFDNALNLAPYSPVIKCNKASTLYMLKDNEKSISLLMDLKRDYPLFIEPQINLLSIYANTGRDSLAVELLKEISEKRIEPQAIKNYFVFEKIKNFYNEKSLH
jgi:O-antigen ligase